LSFGAHGFNFNGRRDDAYVEGLSNFLLFDTLLCTEYRKPFNVQGCPYK
jgi:hypothetical protein